MSYPIDNYPQSLVTVTRYGAYQVAKIVTYLSQDDEHGVVPEYWIAPYHDPFAGAEWFNVNLDD